MVAETNNRIDPSQLQDLVIETDAGARKPDNKLVLCLLLGTALLWSLFQLWTASKFPFDTGFLLFDDVKKRSIHLAFAVFLAFLAYPAFKSSPRKRVPIIDFLLAILGAYCAAYYFINYDDLSNRAGIVFTRDIVVGVAGLLLLLEATRRSLGMPLLVIAVVFLLYSYFGSSSVVPELIRHGGQSLSKITAHQWLTSEGVYGIALGVSTDFVFLFVLFGALLDKAGAGNYFIKVAFSLLGHLRGGPAKAAVLSSAMTGLISGSSIANTVTTGTFTIPLMKRVGFSGEKAGAVEVASSVNGQIMPPVMGAAAFLMVEYVGIPYIEIIKHAVIPAVISYIALLYMVHLEALKADMLGLNKPISRTLFQSFLVYGITVCSIILISLATYHSIAWVKEWLGRDATYFIISALVAVYIFLVWFAARLPDLEADNPDAPVLELPQTAPTVKTGLHYILPIAVLVWFLMVERNSPGYSAVLACSFMMFILVTQRPLKAFFRKTGDLAAQAKAGCFDVVDGLISGARNMIGIGVATAAAGIIVGTVSLTGVGQILTEVIEVLSGGSLVLVLLFTALISLILGMGLPTTANYIVVASLMAQVVQQLGAANGLFVPLIAIHMFVFYFGIMADVTPPVGLASFAAAAISGADPIRTGLQAFAYSLRTAALPFFFIFNTELILVGVDSLGYALFVFVYATTAILIFSSGIQGYFLTRNQLHETVMLLLAATMLFVPQLWLNLFYSKFEEVDGKDLVTVLESADKGSSLKIVARGENKHNEIITVESFIPVKDSAEITLDNYGLFPYSEDGQGRTLYEVDFDSLAFKTGIEFDFAVSKIYKPAVQPHEKWMFVPAIALLIFVIMSQSLRRKKQMALLKLRAA